MTIRSYNLVNLWLRNLGDEEIRYVRIDFVSPDGMFCRMFAIDGTFSHLFFIRHFHVQQSYADTQCEFVDRPDWAPQDHKPWRSEVEA